MRFIVKISEDQFPEYPNYDGIMHVLHFLKIENATTHLWQAKALSVEANAKPEDVARLKEIWPSAVIAETPPLVEPIQIPPDLLARIRNDAKTYYTPPVELPPPSRANTPID